MPNFRKIRFSEKKEEIFIKATEIFAEKGYEKATLEEIAAELKLTKGSLYHYFEGKEDILFQCLIRAHSLANEALSRIVERKDISPRDRLYLAVREHVKVLTTKFVYATLRQQELLLPAKLRQEVREERKRFEDMFVSIIYEGIEEGTFKPVNLKLVSFAILGATNWVARWYSPDGPFSPEKIGETFADYLVGGLEK